MATNEQLRELVRLKAMLRQTDSEAAEHFGTSRRTILRWLQTSEYAALLLAFRGDQKESARTQIAGLADEIIVNMHQLMTSSRSDLVRFQATKTLGEWIGLNVMEEEKEEDDRSETLELLRLIASRPTTLIAAMLPPPKPGGGLPTLTGDMSIVEAIYRVPEKEDEEIVEV